MTGLYKPLLALIGAGLLAFVLWMAQAAAHDPKRPELNKWFDDLRSGKGPCCSEIDGSTLLDQDWESHDGHYRVRVPIAKGDASMIWVDVPDDAVVKEPNLFGRAIVWPFYTTGMNAHVTIRCFMPGSLT